MQPVSQEWKNGQRQVLAPEAFVEILLNTGDPDAQADAQASSNGEAFYSSASDLVEEFDKRPEKVATCEPDLWLLDGSFLILGDETRPGGESGRFYGFIPYEETETLLTADKQEFDCRREG